MADTHYNNIIVERFVNSPVPSNTYVVVDGTNKSCVVIDPGTRVQTEVANFIARNYLSLEYILLTHEHFDHCWGVNYLKGLFPNSKVAASEAAKDYLSIGQNYFNKLYFNDDTTYSIKGIDITISSEIITIVVGEMQIKMFDTKGHTDKSICIDINGLLFTGDTLLLDTKPVVKKRYGGTVADLRSSLSKIFNSYDGCTIIYPGHGESFNLNDSKPYYEKYFSEKGLQPI